MALLKMASSFHKAVLIPQSSSEPRPHLQFKPKTLQHKTHPLIPVIFAKSPRKPGKGDDPYPFYPSNVLLRQGFPSIASDEPILAKCNSNVKILAGADEPEEKLIGRFRREVMKAGVLQECKRRRYFESTQEKKKRKARDAAKRNRKSNVPPIKTRMWEDFKVYSGIHASVMLNDGTIKPKFLFFYQATKSKGISSSKERSIEEEI